MNSGLAIPRCWEPEVRDADALVIGGGFYGCAIAIYLVRQRGLRNVCLIEQEASLLARASYNNQARVHNGFHYPRSFTTAYRSRMNLPHFVRDWSSCVKKDFTKLYAVARNSSKVTAKQFQRFCREIGAPLERADASLRELFETKLIEDVYLAEEYAFDSRRLGGLIVEELDECGVRVLLGTRVRGLSPAGTGGLEAVLERAGNECHSIRSRVVFNCTYSGLNQISGRFPGTTSRLKQEVTEMALVKVPATLQNLGITVMDGPFFSIMPFPSRGLHTLSHVRYTPHFHWMDEQGIDPYARLKAYPRNSRVDRMVRDVRRYIPEAAKVEYVDSIFEVKTVLVKNEADDGRPILFERHAELPGCYSVLGGKIDNIYDALEKLDNERL